MLVPRQEYSRELKMAAMREIDSGKGMAEVARMYQLSPKRLETWKGEWRAKGELAFPGKSARPQTRLDAERITELERKIGQQTMEIDFLKKSVAAFQGASSASRRQWRHRLYEQIQEAAEAGAAVNGLCRAAGMSRAGYYRSGGAGKLSNRTWIYAARCNALRCAGRLTGIVGCMPTPTPGLDHQPQARFAMLRADNLLCVRRRSSCSGPPTPARVADLSQLGRGHGAHQHRSALGCRYHLHPLAVGICYLAVC